MGAEDTKVSAETGLIKPDDLPDNLLRELTHGQIEQVGLFLFPQLVKQRDVSFKAAIKAVLEFIRDWETLSLSDFDSKYGVHKDALGHAKGLRDYITIHFKIGSV